MSKKEPEKVAKDIVNYAGFGYLPSLVHKFGHYKYASKMSATEIASILQSRGYGYSRDAVEDALDGKVQCDENRYVLDIHTQADDIRDAAEKIFLTRIKELEEEDKAYKAKGGVWVQPLNIGNGKPKGDKIFFGVDDTCELSMADNIIGDFDWYYKVSYNETVASRHYGKAYDIMTKIIYVSKEDFEALKNFRISQHKNRK